MPATFFSQQPEKPQADRQSPERSLTWVPNGSVNGAGDQTGFVDTELFIRQAFDENPEKGLELLFRRYHKTLCSHAVRYVYSKEIAEDLVSEVFLRFWKTGGYATVRSSYRFYLFRAVRNEAYNYLRLEFRPTSELVEAGTVESSPSQRPDRITEFDEIFHQVEELIEQLPPQCRKVFLMNRFEGKRYQEIATELGLSVKTIEAHLGKALATLRGGLRDHWLLVGLAWLAGW